MARALDERRCLIDRARELNLLAGRVVEQPASVIAYQVANDQRHLERISSKPRLIAADDDIAPFCVFEQRPDTLTRVEVIAGLAVVHVLMDRGARAQLQPIHHVQTSSPLHIQAELLLAVVILRAPEIDAYVHRYRVPGSLIVVHASPFHPGSLVFIRGYHAMLDQRVLDQYLRERARHRLDFSLADLAHYIDRYHG